MTEPVSLQLARRALGIRSHDLDVEEVHAATRALIDWYAATVAGSEMAPAKVLLEALEDEALPGFSRIVGTDRRTSARLAALVNGTASHVAELDDIFREGIYHPGSPTVAAALALGEKLGATGQELLRAVCVGYELGDRVAAAINPAHYHFWHTTGTVGTLGAAAACAELLELDELAFAHALATATTMAAGLQQAFRSDAMSKPLHAGHAAEAGLLAGLAAQKGFTGALDVLDGELGFGVAMSDGADWSIVDREFDSLLIARATVKNHSCCGHTFAAVDGALQLRAEGVHAEDVESIGVRTYTTAIKVAGNRAPKTAFEARFSTSYCVAAALALGSVRLRAFTDDNLEDDQIRDLEQRVTVVSDSAMEAAFPGQRQAIVTVIGRDGQTFSAHRTTRKGDPDDPLTDEELNEKFMDLSEPVLGTRGSESLLGELWHIADVDDVRVLRS